MPSRFDKQTRAKAVRLVKDHLGDYESEWAAIKTVSGRLETCAETLRKWIRQSEVDAGEAPGVPTESAREIHELKRKCAELKRTVEVLKAATSFMPTWRLCRPLVVLAVVVACIVGREWGTDRSSTSILAYELVTR